MLKYVMKQAVLTRIAHKKGKVVCARCGKPISNGDSVVSSSRQSRTQKVYHNRCYESMLI